MLKSSYLYVPLYVTDPETKAVFSESIKSSFTLMFDSMTTDRQVIDSTLYYEVDIRSSKDITSPKYLFAAHQTELRNGVPNKANKKQIPIISMVEIFL